MGELLQFQALTRMRSKPDRTYALVTSDLQLYASDVRALIEEWKLKEVEECSCRNETGEIEAVGQTISDCVTTFVASAGNWHGRWPLFARDNVTERLFARCVNHVRWSLSRRIQIEVIPEIVNGYELAIKFGGPPQFDLASDYSTLVSLKQFIREIGEEVRHQAISIKITKSA